MQLIIAEQYPEKVIPLINKAEKSISVMVYEWRHYKNQPSHPVNLFTQSFVRASNRGVDVKAILRNRKMINKLNSVDISACKLHSKKKIHAKFIIIDNSVAIIGSHNFTQMAFTQNYEVSTIIDDEKVVSRLVTFFDKLYNK